MPLSLSIFHNWPLLDNFSFERGISPGDNKKPHTKFEGFLIFQGEKKNQTTFFLGTCYTKARPLLPLPPLIFILLPAVFIHCYFQPKVKRGEISFKDSRPRITCLMCISLFLGMCWVYPASALSTESQNTRPIQMLPELTSPEEQGLEGTDAMWLRTSQRHITKWTWHRLKA